MDREKILPRALCGEPFFRWRGGAVSRIENLSDVVFAFALTLIVVSLEVPRNVGELHELVGREAEDVAVDARHPLEPPVLAHVPDGLVDLLTRFGPTANERVRSPG